MNKRFCSLRLRSWVAGVAAVALVATLAFAAGSMHEATTATGNQVPWYADTVAPSSQQHMATPAAMSKSDQQAVDYADSLSKAFRDAADKVLPSVVMITNSPAVAQTSQNEARPPERWWQESPFGEENPFGDMLPGFPGPEMRRFFRELPSVPEMPRHGMTGIGSGVIVDPSGVILTNNHVVEGGGRLMVRLHDGREFEATAVQQDPKTDIAILRIKGATGLKAASLGNSDDVKVGDWVIALGQPFGLEGTVTAGIVSAKGRGLGITERESFIQTDAAINPGNSGGPLVNLKGQVIGIDTAISSRNGAYQGVGFAIPINLAKWVGGELERYGSVHRAYLGVMIQPVTQPLADQFGVKVHEGVLVTEVQPGTPAAKAGLKTGDVVVKFNGKAVTSPQELQNLVERAPVKGKQQLVVVRDGKQVPIEVTLKEQPADFGRVQSKSSSEPGKSESSQFEKLGLEVEPLTAEVADQLGYKDESGLVITDVRAGSPADQASLESGMLITEVDHRPVKTVDDFRKATSGQSLEKGVLLLVRTPEGARFVVIRATG
jgi:serine protease Do